VALVAKLKEEETTENTEFTENTELRQVLLCPPSVSLCARCGSLCFVFVWFSADA
jgi:hypothetical protein